MSEEETCRRADFLGGSPTQLADGTVWYIPAPQLALRPIVAGSTDGEVDALTTFGLDFDRLVKNCQAATTVAEQAQALLALAVDLLGRNYDLPSERYGDLLQYDPTMSDRNWPLQAIYEIAIGDGTRTWANWVRLGVLLAGIDPDRIALADAIALAQIQVTLGRHVPADRWVDHWRIGSQGRSLDAFGAC